MNHDSMPAKVTALKVSTTEAVLKNAASSHASLKEQMPAPAEPVPAPPPPSVVAPAPPVAGVAQLLTERVRLALVRFGPLAYYRVVRLGPAGVVGIGAMLAAALVTVVVLTGQRQATQSVAEQLARLQGHPNSAASNDATIGKVITGLPARQDIPAIIGVMLEQAQVAGVSLDNGHYAYGPAKNGSVGRYEFEFPVKADYPRVRKFIDLTLAAVPSAGLSRLRIERKVVGDSVVSADIRFEVFVRGGG